MEINDPSLLVSPQDGSAFQLATDFVVIKVRASQTQGRYALLDWTVGPQAGSVGHRHEEFEETFYLLEGELDIEVGNEAQRIGPGALVRIPAGVRHAYSNPHAAPARMLVTLLPGGMEECFEQFGVAWHPPSGLHPPVPLDLANYIRVAREQHHTEYEFD
jgi:quercetin dioxygenase-like cupin family protein